MSTLPDASEIEEKGIKLIANAKAIIDCNAIVIISGTHKSSNGPLEKIPRNIHDRFANAQISYEQCKDQIHYKLNTLCCSIFKVKTNLYLKFSIFSLSKRDGSIIKVIQS